MEIKLLVEYLKNKRWGYVPTLSLEIKADGQTEIITTTVSGAGFDRVSSGLQHLLNQSHIFKKALQQEFIIDQTIIDSKKYQFINHGCSLCTIFDYFKANGFDVNHITIMNANVEAIHITKIKGELYEI